MWQVSGDCFDIGAALDPSAAVQAKGYRSHVQAATTKTIRLGLGLRHQGVSAWKEQVISVHSLSSQHIAVLKYIANGSVADYMQLVLASSGQNPSNVRHYV